MPSAAELKQKYEAERPERQCQEDEEKAWEEAMLKEIAEAEEMEKKAEEEKAWRLIEEAGSGSTMTGRRKIGEGTGGTTVGDCLADEKDDRGIEG